MKGFLFSAPQNKMEMINMAKAIASNAMVILKFAHVIAEQSVDERLGVRKGKSIYVWKNLLIYLFSKLQLDFF